jgi:arginyl-tRNA synthetase
MISSFDIICDTLRGILPETSHKFIKLMYKNGSYDLKTLKPISMDMNISIDDLTAIIVNGFHNTMFNTNKSKYCISFVPSASHCSEIVKSVIDNDIIAKHENTKRILVDYASPNVCKNLHVGHLRSSIIGQVTCNILRMYGHDVHAINHVGDWGTQFGMLIQHLEETYPELNEENMKEIAGDLQGFYSESKKRFDEDEEFKNNAYAKVVQLQSHDESIIEKWNMLKDISRKSYEVTFKRLGVDNEEKGESFYQQFIPDLVDELQSKGVLTLQDDGRTVVQTDISDVPLIIIKSNGGYTYDTTDLSALRYRLVDMKMEEIYYVVDGGDSHKKHFKMIFDVAKRCGWLTTQKVKHVDFGFVKGSDGKIFRSRLGGTVKLDELLNEAIEKMRVIMKERNNTNTAYDVDTENKIIERLAMGAVKYSDLKCKRQKDYTFSFDRMLTFEGDSCPYLMYNLVRIMSIGRKLKQNGVDHTEIAYEREEYVYDNEYELTLIRFMSQFPNIVNSSYDKMEFHQICKFMYDLSSMFSKFITNCRVINFDNDKVTIKSVNYSRILLCEAVKKIYMVCFQILGIDVLDHM